MESSQPDYLNNPQQLLELVSTRTKKPAQEIQEMVKEKMAKFSGMLSESGAAFLVAKELGIDLNLSTSLRQTRPLNALKQGMQNVDVEARIASIFPPREFESNGRKGKLQNITLHDASGITRLTLWNEQVDKYSPALEKGTWVRIQNALVKTFKEQIQLQLNYNGTIQKLERADLIMPQTRKVNELNEGMHALLKVEVTRVHKGKFYYSSCPQCKRKVETMNEKHFCNACGQVQEPTPRLLLSLQLEDDTGNMRGVVFDEGLEALLAQKKEDLLKDFNAQGEAFWDTLKEQLIGKPFTLEGRTKKNAMSGELEFQVKGLA
ncbi:MAG: DUF2240 family protein [Candidatus Diapherotrites archaeon]|nr:DUF2240 family protein [Candidatus Diapherotrites archaeon]